MPSEFLTRGVEPALRKVLWDAIHHERLLYGKKVHNLKSFFRVMDQTGERGVRKWELRQAMDRMDMGLSRVQHDRLLRTIDTDLSGLIDFVEFVRFMRGDEVEGEAAAEPECEPQAPALPTTTVSSSGEEDDSDDNLLEREPETVNSKPRFVANT